ncbi:hypothetical protein CGK52_23865, partial [Vibrio parahaemolyticus]
MALNQDVTIFSATPIKRRSLIPKFLAKRKITYCLNNMETFNTKFRNAFHLAKWYSRYSLIK